MKKLSLYLGLALLMATSVSAQKITVINENATAEISIDGQYVANKSVRNYEVEPGSHVVTVKDAGKTIYSKTIQVEYGITQTINTSAFVNIPQTKYRKPSRGAKEVETKRVRESIGSFAIGGHAGPVVSGLTIRKFIDNVGFQFTGWTSSDKTGRFDMANARILYRLADTLVMNNIMSVYVGYGAGNSYDSQRTEEEGSERRVLSEWILGLEIPTYSPNAQHENVVFALLSNLDNSFLTLELSLSTITTNEVLESEGIAVSGGLLFYF
ncbi:hypothetical protein HOH87_04865 [bacterium]|jgi:hypothetical protein|nr:hypothetical protein [bacterium]